MISIPHFPQGHMKSCIPASVRMVLHYLGIERSEAEISQVLDTQEEGTSLLNVPMLADAGWGVTATADEISFQVLKENMDQGVPVIVAVETKHLPHWKGMDNCLHALVVVGYDNEFVYVNDPKFVDAPQTVTWQDFSAAWAAVGYFGAILKKEE